MTSTSPVSDTEISKALPLFFSHVVFCSVCDTQFTLSSVVYSVREAISMAESHVKTTTTDGCDCDNQIRWTHEASTKSPVYIRPNVDIPEYFEG